MNNSGGLLCPRVDIPRTVLVLTLVLILAACNGESGMPEEPRPLDNPSVFRSHDLPLRSHVADIVLQPGDRTEVKLVLEQDQVLLFQWMSNGVPVYSDFHGHDPDDDSFWLRYREQDAAISSYGSLVAPMDGEHGWYYRNDSDREAIIDLRVSGYFTDVVDYGIFDSPEVAD